jgi:hypothetical protein
MGVQREFLGWDAALLERARGAGGGTRAGILGVALGLALVTLVAGGVRVVQLIGERDGHPSVYRDCVLEFAPHVPSDALILLRGGPRYDDMGREVAYNESMVFAWMDRKGFNYPADDYSIETLDAYAARGARYWIAKPLDLADRAQRAELRGRYAHVTSCGGLILYDLSPP